MQTTQKNKHSKDDHSNQFKEWEREIIKDIEEKMNEMEEVKKLFDKSKQRETRISSTLIAEKCLSKEDLQLPQEALAEKILQITKLKLDRCGIKKLENLECFDKVTHAYFQYNEIEEISDAFTFMPNLLFLAIFNNKIKKIENLSSNIKLEFLDISNNNISDFDVNELPKSIRYLNYNGNPCCEDKELRLKLIKHLPKIRKINEMKVTLEEKRQAGLQVEEEDIVDYFSDEETIKTPRNIEEIEKAFDSIPKFDRTLDEDNLKEGNHQSIYRKYMEESNKMFEEQKRKLMEEFDQQEERLKKKREEMIQKIKMRRQALKSE